MPTLNELHPGDVFRVIDDDVLFKRGKASVERDTRGNRFIKIKCEMLGRVPHVPGHRQHHVFFSSRIKVSLVQEREPKDS